MSEQSSGFSMEQFNINELAGATGLILGAVGGILAIIFKSRCYCKFRIGCSDKYNLCMCERKPPPDNVAADASGGGDDDDDEKPDLIPKNKSFIKKNKTTEGPPKESASRAAASRAAEPEIDRLV